VNRYMREFLEKNWKLPQLISMMNHD
jgi:hypothetical protein